MSLNILLAKLLYWFLSFKEDPDELFKEVGVNADDDILEIGCAIGFHTFSLADIAEDGEVYAVDISEEFIDYVNKKREKGDYQNLTAICKDAVDIDIENKKLDKVVCFHTLHELEDPKEALNNWLDHLKSGGLFLYRDPELSPNKVLKYSNGELSEVDKIENVNIFKQK